MSPCKNLVQLFQEEGATLASGSYLYVANYFHFFSENCEGETKSTFPFHQKGGFFPPLGERVLLEEKSREDKEIGRA